MTSSRQLGFDNFCVRPGPLSNDSLSDCVGSTYRQCGCESALRKPNLLIDPTVGFAPSGAQVAGLIHTARCLTGNLTALLAPAVSGLEWPGGLSSARIKDLRSLEELAQARTVSALPAPLEVGLNKFLLCIFLMSRSFF